MHSRCQKYPMSYVFMYYLSGKFPFSRVRRKSVYEDSDAGEYKEVKLFNREDIHGSYLRASPEMSRMYLQL